MPSQLQSREVVVLGGGVAALEATLALRDRSDGAARVTLIAPHSDVALEALAPARAFDLAAPASCSLVELARERGFSYLQDTASAVDVEAKRVSCASGRTIAYESLVVAVGAARVAAFAEALTYSGGSSQTSIVALRRELASGAVRSLAIVVPSGQSWALPAYELALLFAREGRGAGADVAITIVTPEPEPLGLFGPLGTAAVAELLGASGIGLRASAHAEVDAGRVLLRPSGETLEVDRIVALPRAVAVELDGIAVDSDGFIAVDGHGRVPHCRDVYAAGDCTAFPIKQGGLAVLQADVVVAQILTSCGAAVPTPTFRPLMRGKLITGDAEWFLRYPATGGGGAGDVDEQELWMPAVKVWGAYLPSELERPRAR